MSESFKYEVFVPANMHIDDDTDKVVIDRPAKLIAAVVGVYPEPTRAELLVKYAEELKEAGIDFGSIEEVKTSVCPF